MFTHDHLQELFSFSANGTPVVSMYLDTDCSQQPAETIKLQVKGMLRELNGANEQDAGSLNVSWTTVMTGPSLDWLFFPVYPMISLRLIR